MELKKINTKSRGQIALQAKISKTEILFKRTISQCTLKLFEIIKLKLALLLLLLTSINEITVNMTSN